MQWRNADSRATLHCMTATSTRRTIAPDAQRVRLDFTLIDAWCERNSVQPNELAARCGFDRITLWRLRTGRNAPTLDTALSIAAVIGVSVEQLCGRDAA